MHRSTNFFSPDKAAIGTILCSGNHEGGLCPHYCHSSNFWIVFITTDPLLAKAQRYSSELGALEDWTECTKTLAKIDNRPATPIGGQ
jgi:hypothetical protein